MAMTPHPPPSLTLRHRPWVLHVGIWIALWLLESLMFLPEPMRVLRMGALLLSMAPAVYAHFWAFDRLLLKRRWGWYALALPALLVLGSLVNAFALRLVQAHPMPFPAVAASLFGFLLITTGIKYGLLGIQSTLALRELRERQVQDELALLKHQINPHFLFNTLNNLYALARKHEDPRLGKGLASLARLMRYLIDDTRADRVPLEKELEQVQAYIDLQRLRFSPEDDIAITFAIEGDPARGRIAPMLLIPFVENAFKHAPSLQQPVRIAVSVELRPEALRFRVENTINARRPHTDASPGIGLANVRRRLELQYPDRHTLSIQEEDGVFRVGLTLREAA